MEEEFTERPFDEVMLDLLESEPLPIQHIYRLSDLGREDFAMFCERFSAADVERRQALVRHMADLSEDNFVVDFAPFFDYCLDDEAVPVRLAALDGLWDATDLRLVPHIIELLQNDPDDSVRAAAAAALSHYVMMAEWGEISGRGLEPIVPALLAAYDAPDASLAVRRAALEALGASTHDRIPRLIGQAYESGNQELQLSSIFAMGNSGDTRWLSIVLDEMESPLLEMRAEAARAAGNIGSSDAVDTLLELVHDEDLDVALAAVNALGQIGGENVADYLGDLLEDAEFSELHDAIEDALEEMNWLDSELDMLSFGGQEYEDDLLDDEDDEDYTGLEE